MSDLRVNIGSIREAASSLRSKAEEMQSTVNNANSAIGPVREMTSNRLFNAVEVWHKVKGNFLTSLDELDMIAKELNDAAEAFEIADGQRRT